MSGTKAATWLPASHGVSLRPPAGAGKGTHERRARALRLCVPTRGSRPAPRLGRVFAGFPAPAWSRGPTRHSRSGQNLAVGVHLSGRVGLSQADPCCQHACSGARHLHLLRSVNQVTRKGSQRSSDINIQRKKKSNMQR